MKLMFASGNAGKVREAGEIADVLGARYSVALEIVPMPEKLDIPETGSTYGENSLQKAQFVWDRYHADCFADDSGLEVEALGGAPGVHTARYCDRNFASGMDKLLAELEAVGAMAPEQRRAAFVCCITVMIDGKAIQFEGRCPGRIALQKSGNGGFGFDPVFIPDASAEGLCMAEMPEEEKNLISHRGVAMDGMIKWLANRL